MLLKVVLIVVIGVISIEADQHTEPIVKNDVILERLNSLFEELEIVVKEVIASGSLANSADRDFIDDSSRSVFKMTLAERIQKRFDRVWQRRNKFNTVILIAENQAPPEYPTISVHPILPGQMVLPPAIAISSVPSVFSSTSLPSPDPLLTGPITASSEPSSVPLLVASSEPSPVHYLKPSSVPSTAPLQIPSSVTSSELSPVHSLKPSSVPSTAPLQVPSLVTSSEASPVHSLLPILSKPPSATLPVLSPAPAPPLLFETQPGSLTNPVPHPLLPVSSKPSSALLPTPPLLFGIQPEYLSNPPQVPATVSLTVPLTTIITEPEHLNLSELLELAFPEEEKPNEWPFIINETS